MPICWLTSIVGWFLLHYQEDRNVIKAFWRDQRSCRHNQFSNALNTTRLKVSFFAATLWTSPEFLWSPLAIADIDRYCLSVEVTFNGSWGHFWVTSVDYPQGTAWPLKRVTSKWDLCTTPPFRQSPHTLIFLTSESSVFFSVTLQSHNTPPLCPRITLKKKCSCF